MQTLCPKAVIQHVQLVNEKNRLGSLVGGVRQTPRDHTTESLTLQERWGTKGGIKRSATGQEQRGQDKQSRDTAWLTNCTRVGQKCLEAKRFARTSYCV